MGLILIFGMLGGLFMYNMSVLILLVFNFVVNLVLCGLFVDLLIFEVNNLVCVFV